MFRDNSAEPATTERASLIVFVAKNDGSWRFCIDYCNRNAVIVQDGYPIPHMNKCIDSLRSTTLFLKLDANTGHWQIEIDEKDMDDAAFVTHNGHYQYTRMPFGLKNALATFQQAMDIISALVKWQHASV